MKILVCGGRDFGEYYYYPQHAPRRRKTGEALIKAEKEYRFILDTLTDLSIKYSKLYTPDDNWLPTDLIIINGGAHGADNVSTDWAIVHYAQLKEYPADWKRFGKIAGFIRNQKMLDIEKPDLVVAFPGCNGTADMVKKSRTANVEVMEIEYDTQS